MTAGAVSPVAVRVGLVLAGVVGLIVLLLIVTGGSGSAVPGMPPSVVSALGGDPDATVTLQGDVLGLISSPDVQRIGSLETRLARQPGVEAQYGVVSWLSGQLDTLQRSIARHTTAQVTRAQLLVRAGASGGVDLGDQELVSTMVFGTGADPVPSIRWLVPNDNAVRIFLRLRRPLSHRALAGLVNRLVTESGLSGVVLSVGVSQ